MSSNFTIEFQNVQTNWEWKEATLISDEDNNGVEFNDSFIVPDLTPKYPHYTWTNFRILCIDNSSKINLWSKAHNNPEQLDILGRNHQSGNAVSTYSDYRSLSSIFLDSNRLYFWIKASDQNSEYEMSQTIYDEAMSTRAVSLDGDIIPSSDIADVVNWLGWNPQTAPSGLGNYAHNVTSGSSNANIARWIIGWDNTCGNTLTTVINPAIGFEYQAAILDTYSMIEGLVDTGKQWLGCPSNSYIYGKMLYSLEDHNGPGILSSGEYDSFNILNTVGFKSWQINIASVLY